MRCKLYLRLNMKKLQMDGDPAVEVQIIYMRK